MKKIKDPDAVGMANKRWGRINKKKRSIIMSKVSAARVAALTPEKRKKIGQMLTKARKMASKRRLALSTV